MSLLKIQNDLISLSVNANQGARICEFSLNGKNALFTGLPEWGSTFWPSPQHAWGWPPPATLDTHAYHAKKGENFLHFSSEPCERTGLQLDKKIMPTKRGFTVLYTLRNIAQIPQSYACWEITRVAGGITFFASDETPLEHSSLKLTSTEGCYWHHYDVATQTDNLKSFANGSAGWLANAHNGLLLLKQFPQIPSSQIAPQEAEVEIYAHGDQAQPYIEIEQQGAYVCLQPGESAQWGVDWSLFVIPEDMQVAAGSGALVQWVKTLLADN